MEDSKFSTNLIQAEPYDYVMQDVSEPNLFPKIMDYDEIPKVPFNFRRVPMSFPENIWITDTTFRDGQQSRTPFTARQVVDLYKMMHRLSGKKGIIRQCEFFVYTKKDREAIEQCQALGYEFPEITTWIRASKEDFKTAREMGIRETGILMSCSDFHIFKKMNIYRTISNIFMMILMLLLLMN